MLTITVNGKAFKLSKKQELILERQLDNFRERFGRNPLSGEPVFFDPKFNVPTAWSYERLMQVCEEHKVEFIMRGMV